MTTRQLLLFPLLAFALFLGGCRQQGSQTAWNTNWESAAEEAKLSGKPILALFTRPDVSPWSIRLQEEILETDQFRAWADQRVVLLSLDFSGQPNGAEPPPALQQLAQKYNVVGYPTVIFADAEGKKLGSLRYEKGGPGPWIAHADEVLAGKQQAPLPWIQAWDEASKESKATGKPILMDFTGSDWCIFCIKLKNEVFETEAFRKWSAEKVVLLEVDFPRSFDLDPNLLAQNEEMAARYGVRGFPTIVFADHTGKQIGSLGYAEGGPEVWLKKAGSALIGAPEAEGGGS